MTRSLSRSLPLLWAAAALLAALSGSAFASERSRVPDTGTFTTPSVIPMKWEKLPPGGAVMTMVSGEGIVSLRLDTRAWRGRFGTIRLELPPLPFGKLEAAWEPRSRLLLPGRSVSGEPGGAVYSGPIDFDFLEDTLALRLRADGAWLDRSERLEFSFIIETPNP